MLAEKDSKDLFLTCLELYRYRRRGLIDSNSTWTQEVRATLKELLSRKAKALCNRELGLDYAEEHPGYLHYTHKNVRVYFPWLIVDDLPSVEILNYLIEVAIQIKACSLSFSCLSGSALYFNSLRSISDIDFLEYEVNPELDPRHIKRPKDFAVLKEMNSYIEYIAETPFYGTIAVTNMIVGIDSSQVGLDASHKSSPYQEAPLTQTPRELCDPIALGRYIQYLAEKALSYVHNNPAKVAKRLLPLSRIIEDRKLADAILTAFDSKAVQNALRVKQKVELIQKLRKTKAEALRRFEALAHRDILTIRGLKSGGAALDDTERTLVQSLDAAVKHIAIVNYEKLKVFAHG